MIFTPLDSRYLTGIMNEKHPRFFKVNMIMAISHEVNLSTAFRTTERINFLNLSPLKHCGDKHVYSRHFLDGMPGG